MSSLSTKTPKSAYKDTSALSHEEFRVTTQLLHKLDFQHFRCCGLGAGVHEEDVLSVREDVKVGVGQSDHAVDGHELVQPLPAVDDALQAFSRPAVLRVGHDEVMVAADLHVLPVDGAADTQGQRGRVSGARASLSLIAAVLVL